MTKDKLIQLIHVARRELKLDDDTYRQKLQAATGKTSCKQMNLRELNAAYQAFKDSGFKRSFKRHKTAGKARSTEHQRSAIAGKIRAIWREMYRHGFLKTDSDAGLNAYVKRQTRKRNDGEGVAALRWLDDEMASAVLEDLKQWHAREMRINLAAAGIYTHEQWRSYDVLAGHYNHLLDKALGRK